jgi:hypothetical protein
MKKIKLLEQFLDEQKIEEGLFDVVTKSKAFLRNPIAATKITNNGKKLAQSQVDSAANDLDFEKRKLAANKAAKAKIETLKKKGDSESAQKVKDDYDDSADVLKAAHDQKDDALKDKVSSVGDRIDDLSKTNSTLQDLASLVKTAARVKKNEVLLKGADDEEKKQLKIQLQKDTEHIQNLQKGFGDYESTGDDAEDKKSEDDKKDIKVDTNVPDKPAEKPANKPAEKPVDKPADKPLTTTSKTPEASKETPEDELARTRQDVQDQQRIISDYKGRIKSQEDKISDLKAGKYDKKTVTDPQAEIAKLQKNIETEKGDLDVANTELVDLVKASQDAEKKMPKKEPAAEAPKAEPAAEAPKNPVGRPKKEEPAAEAPKADSKRKEVEDQIAKDNAEPAKVTTDTKQYKIDKLEKDAKAAEDEHKKILLDPKYQEGVKKDKELQDKADSVDKELSVIDKEKDPSGYEAKMKEVQAANQVIKDFRKKFSEDNKDLEDKADAAEIKMRQLNKELQAAKEEAKKTPNESLTLLKSFNDFVTEKYKS